MQHAASCVATLPLAPFSLRAVAFTAAESSINCIVETKTKRDREGGACTVTMPHPSAPLSLDLVRVLGQSNEIYVYYQRWRCASRRFLGKWLQGRRHSRIKGKLRKFACVASRRVGQLGQVYSQLFMGRACVSKPCLVKFFKRSSGIDLIVKAKQLYNV